MHSAMTCCLTWWLVTALGSSLGQLPLAALSLPLRVAALAVHMHNAAGFLLHILSRRLHPAVVPPPTPPTATPAPATPAAAPLAPLVFILFHWA